MCTFRNETYRRWNPNVLWFGIVSNTGYFFVLEQAKPVSIFAVGSWFNARQADLDEFSDMQGELPF